MRIYFLKREDCNDFFKEIRKNKIFNSWEKLGKFLGTSRSMIEGYRSRKWHMPEKRFFALLNLIEPEKQEYFLKLIKRKNNNWGQVIGGKKAYKNNKKYFEDGRKKAREIRLSQAKYNFDTNMPLSKELCEFIGTIIGDGFTNKYSHSYQTQITGDNKLDSKYYHNRLKPICEKLFNISPKITEKGSWIRLNIYSKRLFEMLTKRFNIPAGVKCYSIMIPLEIIKAEEKLLNSTIKGMFNTDGGIGFDRRKTYKKPYIRINYTSASKKLIEQINKVLLTYSIKHSVHKKENKNKEKTIYMIQINGIENAKKFLSKIGFSNERHLNKIQDLIS